ncbi:transmembrane protein 81-like [Pseudophryne corroboree]|uniref:transmembrane protein 81-like n=1 Tax=Pseudophryne corroboree TaxID=495146 RepID=UPI003081AF45
MLALLPLLFIIFGLCRPEERPLEKIRYVTIPAILKGISAKMIVESTICSTSCGIGTRIESRCIVDKDGMHIDCEKVAIECVISWMCGLRTYTRTVGDSFNMTCFDPVESKTDPETLDFYWRVARGRMTTEDEAFNPIKLGGYMVEFPYVLESHAGTYRCDIYSKKERKLVQRLDFGLKVRNPKAASLNTEQLVARSQMVKAAITQGRKRPLTLVRETLTLKERLLIILVVGIITGLLAGCFYALIRWCVNKWKNLDRERDLENGEFDV